MVKKIDKNAQRLKRHTRVRGKISGTPERPRLNVFRSNADIYAQVIDDVNGVTLASASTLDKAFEGAAGNCEAAKQVGKLVAERALNKGIKTVVSIAAVISSTVVWQLSQRVPAKADSSFKAGRKIQWLTITKIVQQKTLLRNSLKRLYT